MKLHNLYSSSGIIKKIRRMKCAGHVARIGENVNAYRILVGKLRRKRPLGIPRHRRIILKWILDR
jgi:hypothetical protein